MYETHNAAQGGAYTVAPIPPKSSMWRKILAKPVTEGCDHEHGGDPHDARHCSTHGGNRRQSTAHVSSGPLACSSQEAHRSFTQSCKLLKSRGLKSRGLKPRELKPRAFATGCMSVALRHWYARAALLACTWQAPKDCRVGTTCTYV